MELRDSGSLSVSALELPMAKATSLMTKICPFWLKKDQKGEWMMSGWELILKGEKDKLISTDALKYLIIQKPFLMKQRNKPW